MNSLLEANKPVAFFFNGIGDHVLNLPALRALAKAFKGRLTLLYVSAKQEFFFRGLPDACHIPIDLRFGTSGRRRTFDAQKVADQITGCDLFISLVPWISQSLIELLDKLKPEVSLGFFPNYSLHLPLDFNKHSADLAFDIVQRITPNYKFEDFAQPPIYPEEEREKTRRIKELLPRGTRVLAVHDDTDPSKMWDAASLARALDLFLDEHRDFVALMIGSSDCSLEAGIHEDRIIPCGGLSLANSCCLVSSADLFLGVDSCMLHVADFSRVPGVGLFGPTQSYEFGFRVGPNITIQANESLSEIQPEQVYLALESLLAEPAQSSLWYCSKPAA
jgi:ADP-heptose:LPS heptosyltransferase